MNFYQLKHLAGLSYKLIWKNITLNIVRLICTFFLFSGLSYASKMYAIDNLGQKTHHGILIDTLIIIKSGDTLTVKPGTKIVFANYAGIVVEKGLLLSKGTKQDPIIYTSTADTNGIGQPFDWNGITISKQAYAILSNCLIEFANIGLKAESPECIRINSCLFTNNGITDMTVNDIIIKIKNLQPFSFPQYQTNQDSALSKLDFFNYKNGNEHIKSNKNKRTIILASAALLLGGGAAGMLITAHKTKSDYNQFVPGNPEYDIVSQDERNNTFLELRRKYKQQQYIGIALIGFGCCWWDWPRL